MRQCFFLFASICVLALSGCKDVGFRRIDDASEKASVQSAQEAMHSVALALENYHDKTGAYPKGSETGLFDSIKYHFIVPIDPGHLYRNEKEQSNYIAIGNRRNKLVYHNPPTVGAGAYTLYWVGVNGVDEEGRGDDVFPAQAANTKQIIRRITRSFKGKGSSVEFVLKLSGLDPAKDNAQLTIKDGPAILYKDSWQIRDYIGKRDDLTEPEKQRIIADEVDRFFRPSHFLRLDSLSAHPDIKNVISMQANSLVFDLRGSDTEMFSYYAGNNKSVILIWDGKRKKLITLID